MNTIQSYLTKIEKKHKIELNRQVSDMAKMGKIITLVFKTTASYQKKMEGYKKRLKRITPFRG